MVKYDDIFKGERDALAQPKLRFWAQRKAEGLDLRCEIVRLPDLLGFKPAKLYVHICDVEKKEIQCDEAEWDDDLDAGLVKLHVKAIDPANEIQRFSMSLRAAFRPAERRFGDGFFNAVLVEWIKESDFADAASVKEILPHAYANQPYRGKGNAYQDCRDLIQFAVRDRALALTDDLRYRRDEAERILASALAQYLDERFSVSVGRAMGWK